MVARLQRLRQQRERQEQREPPARPSGVPATPRFQPGDRIVCAPYGHGEVLESRLEDDHELLVVTFAEHGRLTIDAAVSAARLEARPADQGDDDALL
jgi:DEAD/DEAH box helicase domain-containing protein